MSLQYKDKVLFIGTKSIEIIRLDEIINFDNIKTILPLFIEQ